MGGIDNIDFFDPEMVRLATYCSNAGKTWRRSEDNQLITEINGKFIPIVRDLIGQFLPPTSYSVGGIQVEVKPGSGMWKHHLTVKDSVFLEELEKHGYSLGSKRRKPNPEVVGSPHLFQYWLRVIWEIHGRVNTQDGFSVMIEEKYPQELASLKELLLKVDVYSEMRRSNFYYLEISDKRSIQLFFDLFKWEADWKYGKRSMDLVKNYLQDQETGRHAIPKTT